MERAIYWCYFLSLFSNATCAPFVLVSIGLTRKEVSGVRCSGQWKCGETTLFFFHKKVHLGL